MLVALQEYQQAHSRALVKSQLSAAFKSRGLPGRAMVKSPSGIASWVVCKEGFDGEKKHVLHL